MWKHIHLHPLLKERAISSAGSEHLVYTEGVGGSNPSSPTTKNPFWRQSGKDFFVLDMPELVYRLCGGEHCDWLSCFSASRPCVGRVGGTNPSSPTTKNPF